MNEALCRALLQARLSEEDVAAGLQVDPKTVRRWLEGRVPYLRHRWALAAMTGTDERDLWPQVRAARSLPAEVVAIYPHRDAVPAGVWLQVLASARREIVVVDTDGLYLAGLPGLADTLAARASDSVRVRICLAGPGTPAPPGSDAAPGGSVTAASAGPALAVFGPLRASGDVAIRLHRVSLPSSVCRADGDLLVCQHAFGIAEGRSPVLRLRQARGGDMVSGYLASAERIWAGARPAG
jgi:transcriptional regulator with XRE-family HTH domain